MANFIEALILKGMNPDTRYAIEFFVALGPNAALIAVIAGSVVQPILRRHARQSVPPGRSW